MAEAATTSRVTSSDGTQIAFDRSGSGPPVVMIGGGPTDRSANSQVAELLAAHFTVHRLRSIVSTTTSVP
jgi:hypothetical protein